ncbi:Male sterility protein [Nannocystis exedens]|uniref:Male sterility protein n=1 Tax=Nannocystis exedens TaxID=54 RepID=A0A1I2EFS5_9BACT|nr:SDR family oxidoreductase [Nannocystis exedens]PCC74774.1 short chain dehydrogenase [Nannocystis exedens]SFE91100.1 Male sterility protein [Nannocystis exedens]
MNTPISIKHSYAGRHVLLTGVTGFLGKVWLAMVLQHVPDIGRIYVLTRKKALRPAADRFERQVATSPCFRPLHEKYGADMSRFISERVEVVSGDVSLPDMGVEDPEVLARLRRDIDLVVNCAGLVDFDPDLRDAMTTNVDGARNAANFVAACDKAVLLHISTCYVTGKRNGLIPEDIRPDLSPDGQPFDVEVECADVQASIDAILAEHESPEMDRRAHDDAIKQIREKGGDENNAMLVRNTARRVKRNLLKDAMVAEGQRRAGRWGFTNIYTYTKNMAEAWIARRLDPGRWSMFRPAIVESAMSYPFPGWNQGFNTCGPLSYALGSWFRHLPCKKGNPFDIIPVDYVCRGMAVAGAALMRGEHAPVYQCGSSDLNLLTIDRAVELVALAHRKHLRTRGDTTLDRVVKSRWDAIAVTPDHPLRIENVRKLTESVDEWLRDPPKGWPEFIRRRLTDLVEHTEDALEAIDKIERMCELYMPFIHDNHFAFVARNLLRHPVVEPEWDCDPRSIDWRHYWIDVHIPGLRKWCFPLFENKTPESYAPRHPFRLRAPEAAPAPHAEVV